MITITQLDLELYEVEISRRDQPSIMRHQVSLGSEAWRGLTDRRVTPEALLMESFRYFLAQEVKPVLPEHFDLAEVGDGFPGWRRHIEQWLERGR